MNGVTGRVVKVCSAGGHHLALGEAVDNTPCVFWCCDMSAR